MTLNLPSLPTEFEVAVIKPTPPDFRFGNFRPQRGGRVNIQGMPLRGFISGAGIFSARTWSWAHRSLWMATVTTSRPRRRTYGPEPAPLLLAEGPRFETIDQDSINMMLRNLLIERFKINTTPRSGHPDLCPHLPEAEAEEGGPRESHRLSRGSAGGWKRPTNRQPRRRTAGDLREHDDETVRPKAANDGGRLFSGHDVYDETGIEGAFDFTLEFQRRRHGGRPGRGGRRRRRRDGRDN